MTEQHANTKVCAQMSARAHDGFMRSTNLNSNSAVWFFKEWVKWDFKHGAFKHKMVSIFQTDFKKFELFILFINYALSINVDCAFQKEKYLCIFQALSRQQNVERKAFPKD